MHPMSDTVSGQFARNILSFFQRDFTDETYGRARAAIIDMIGVMLAGSLHEGGEILRSVILPTAASGKSRVFGTELRLNALDAALLNGTAAHMLDYDDSNSHLHGHVSVAILPAILALADEKGIDGRDVLKAYLTGFEAAARMGNAVSRRQYTHGWHPTTTVGLFGAVAAASVLSDLTEGQTATALGIATSLSAGIKSNFGTMTKPLIVGHANRNALFAVALAKNGFTSGARAFEHHQGFFAVFNGAPDSYDASPLIESWDSVPRILDPVKGNKLKRYPCCYALAAPLDGILSLREEHGLTPGQVREVSIGVHPIRYPHINVPAPQSPLEAKFSTNYTIARALVDGAITLQDFEDDKRFSDPATRSLMERTTLYAYDNENAGGAAVTITTTDGKKLERFVEGALGSTYANALPEEMIRKKFLDCAGRAMPVEQAQSLLERLQQDHFA
jgi:2-methylcitrate dehydratase PrpD